ncbi:hypothetical protein L1887_57780 [Cichorium endivia]|nr:hypothetical protein L1887_57780 [Cichorium endivia]
MVVVVVVRRVSRISLRCVAVGAEPSLDGRPAGVEDPGSVAEQSGRPTNYDSRSLCALAVSHTHSLPCWLFLSSFHHAEPELEALWLQPFVISAGLAWKEQPSGHRMGAVATGAVPVCGSSSARHQPGDLGIGRAANLEESVGSTAALPRLTRRDQIKRPLTRRPTNQLSSLPFCHGEQPETNTRLLLVAAANGSAAWLPDKAELGR